MPIYFGPCCGKVGEVHRNCLCIMVSLLFMAAVPGLASAGPPRTLAFLPAESLINSAPFNCSLSSHSNKLFFVEVFFHVFVLIKAE